MMPAQGGGGHRRSHAHEYPRLGSVLGLAAVRLGVRSICALPPFDLVVREVGASLRSGGLADRQLDIFSIWLAAGAWGQG